MDTIKREANILSDHIVEKHDLSELPSDGQITTADLAEAGHSGPNSVSTKVEVDRVAAPMASSTPRSEVPSGAVSPAAATVDAGVRGTAAARAVEQETGPLFSGDEANELRARWDAIQVAFVDEPRGAVEQEEE